jgi:SAM-dependent methyltransferase
VSKEKYVDELLGIQTVGDQKGFNRSFHYYRYEPTPYSALDQLFSEYSIKSSDHIVDFGCGKGRLNFYINYMWDATVAGIEMNETFYLNAIENLESYVKKMKKDNIYFHCCLAEEYKIDPRDNRFYFFNPFSIQIFMVIINNILRSFEMKERDIELVLYYPSQDYIYFLENHSSFVLKQEIVLPNLYNHNPNERFLIYVLSY